MSESQTEELSLREMLDKAGITQKKIAEKAKVSPAAVSLIVAGKSKSKGIEDIIRVEVEKVLAKGQAAETTCFINDKREIVIPAH